MQITGGGLVQGGITLQEDNRYRSLYFPPSPNTYVLYREDTVNSYLFPDPGGSAGGSGLVTGTQHVSYDIGFGNFTIEASIYITAAPSINVGIIAKDTIGPSGWAFSLATTRRLILSYSFTGFIQSDAVNLVPLNQWTHVAVVRRGTGTNECSFYINGIERGTGTAPDNLNNAFPLRIGCLSAAGQSNGFRGAIAELRWSNIARTITPQGCKPVRYDANTILITANSSTFSYTRDGINRLGLVVQQGSPSVSTSPLTAGGVAKNEFNFGLGDFTIECWIYRTSSGVMGIYNHGLNDISQGLGLSINASNRLSVTQDALIVLSGTITLNTNTWYHIVLQRTNTGTALKTFVNGQQDQIASVGAFSINFIHTYQNRIGYYKSGGWITSPFRGFISNFRISNISRYPSGNGQGCDIPTNPFTWDSNTLLLTGNDKTISYVQNGFTQLTTEQWIASGSGATNPATTILPAEIADFFPFST